MDRTPTTEQLVELRGMILDRERLLDQYGPTLFREGPHTPHRSQVNAKRAKLRRELRHAIRFNSEQIASWALRVYGRKSQ